jgi:hypothetical protein
MPFIGNQPALSYTSFAKQDFTTSVTTSYTLDNPVANANELALFINFVRQEPTTAYSASGTSLTLTSATSASDDMYCVFLGKAVQTVNPPNGSVGTAQLSASGTKDATTFLRGDNTFAVAGGTNTPYFYGRLASDQSVSRAVMTKVTGMTNTEIDSNSAFDGTTFTVPSGQDGKYYIEGVVTGDYSNAGQDGEETVAAIYKNGSSVKLATIRQSSASGQNMRVVTTVASGMLDLSAGNTIELYAHIQDASGNDGAVKGEMSSLLGYKLIT